MTADLRLGDCLKVLPTLAAGSVDAVIMDPPFGIGFKYSTHDDTPAGYGEWLWRAAEIAEAKCNPGSPVFVFQAMTNVRLFSKWFPRNFRIYAAAKNFVQMRPTVMQYAFDPVVCWWTEGKPYSAGTANRDFFVANTAGVISNRDNDQRGHPCPRPLDQMMQMVEQWVIPGGTVLDPFMGSGTTGVACVKLGRHFIGIERDPAYFAIAERRIEQAQAQLALPLFAEQGAMKLISKLPSADTQGIWTRTVNDDSQAHAETADATGSRRQG